MSDKHLVKGDLPGQLCFFRTQYDRLRIYCEPGDPIRLEYELRYRDDGSEYLEEVGRVNLYDEIQSHKMSVDINYLLAKYAQGDPMALQRRQAVYGDFSDMPTTYAEMLNLSIKAQNSFDLLPVDIKNKFNNSMSEWLSTYGSDSWCDRMGLVTKVPVVEEKKEAVVNEP